MAFRTATTTCIVRTFPLRGLSQDAQALCLFLREEAGRCWTGMLRAHIASRGCNWLSAFDLSKKFKGQYNLHSQSIQALAEKLEANVDSARELRKTDPAARYPYRDRLEPAASHAVSTAVEKAGFSSGLSQRIA